MLINSNSSKFFLGTKNTGKALTAFVIDESIAMTRILSQMLEGFGIHVVGSAQDSIAATRSLQKMEIPVDLITIDLAQPKILSYIPTLKSATTQSKVVMVAASENGSGVMESIQMGADFYIMKPFNQKTVFADLQKLFILNPSTK
jgi:DNA-binding response OmpR family regulator